MNKFQYVHIDGKDSSKHPVDCGAPQGSTSGPLIWLIYTLDLPDSLVSDEPNPEENTFNSNGIEEYGPEEVDNEIWNAELDQTVEEEVTDEDEPNSEGNSYNSDGIEEYGPEEVDNEIWIDELDQIVEVEVTKEDEVIHDEEEQKTRADKALIFADDVMATTVRKTRELLKSAIVDKYMKFKKYCVANRLQPNAGKTHYLLLQSNHRRVQGSLDQVVLDGDIVEESLNERVLGMITNRGLLNWGSHVNKLLTDVARKLNSLRRAGRIFTFKRRLETAKAIIISKINYGIECWGHGLTVMQLQSIQAAENRVLRWIIGDNNLRSHKMAKQCGLLTIKQTIVYKSIVRGIKIIRNKKPKNIYQDIINELVTRVRTTRSDLRTLKIARRGVMYDKTWKSHFTNVYDVLPNVLKEGDLRKKANKRALKECVQSNVEPRHQALK